MSDGQPETYEKWYLNNNNAYDNRSKILLTKQGAQYKPHKNALKM